MKQYAGGKDSPDRGHCPVCGHHLRNYGYYWQSVIQPCGVFRITLYRAYCPVCRNTGAFYPLFLKPYTSYEIILGEKVLGACQSGKYMVAW